MTTKEYEKLIYDSPLFTVEKGTSAYYRYENQMIEYLYCYLLSINEPKYVEFGNEILMTAKSCIANYKPESGDFLHYFNRAIALEVRHKSAQRTVDDIRRGGRITRTDQVAIQRIIKFAQTHEMEIYTLTDSTVKKLAECLGYTKEYIVEVLKANDSSVVMSTNGGEENRYYEGEFIDYYEEEFVDYNDGEALDLGVDNQLAFDDNCKKYYDKIESAYVDARKDTKEKVSALLTLDAMDLILSGKVNPQEYTFVDVELVRECVKTHKHPTQREIAARFGVAEASLSRTYKSFLEKIRG